MHSFTLKLKTTTNFILCILFTLILFGCGGGGSGGETQESPTPPTLVVTEVSSTDYTPDPAKLTSAGSSSTELFVEPNFTFNSFKNVVFDLSVIDFNKQPLSDLMLSIFVIDNEITAHDDPRLQGKSLFAKVKTNNNGQGYLTLEMPVKVNNVLIELSAVGIENAVIISLDESNNITYHFQQTI